MNPEKEIRPSKAQNSVVEALSGTTFGLCSGLGKKSQKTGAIDNVGELDKLASELSKVKEKAFLGRTVGQLSNGRTIGRRVAMSRGVVVDDNGKLRCPPGTPNANQFTDLNMSGCWDAPSITDPEEIAKAAAAQIKEDAVRAGMQARMDELSLNFRDLSTIEKQREALQRVFPNANIDFEDRDLDRIPPELRPVVELARMSFVQGILLEGLEFPEVAENVYEINDSLNGSEARASARIADGGVSFALEMSQFQSILEPDDDWLGTQTPNSTIQERWHAAGVHEFGHLVDFTNVVSQMGFSLDNGNIEKVSNHVNNEIFDVVYESLNKSISQTTDPTVRNGYLKKLAKMLSDEIEKGLSKGFVRELDEEELDDIFELAGGSYARYDFDKTGSIAEARAELYARVRIMGHSKESESQGESGQIRRTSRGLLRELLGTDVRGGQENDTDGRRTYGEFLKDLTEAFGGDASMVRSWLDESTPEIEENERKIFEGTMRFVSPENEARVRKEFEDSLPERIFQAQQYKAEKDGLIQRYDESEQPWRGSWNRSRTERQRMRNENRTSQRTERPTLAQSSRDIRSRETNPRRVAGGNSSEEISESIRERNRAVIAGIEEAGGFFDPEGVSVEKQEEVLASSADWDEGDGRRFLLSQKLKPQVDDRSGREYLEEAVRELRANLERQLRFAERETQRRREEFKKTEVEERRGTGNIGDPEWNEKVFREWDMELAYIRRQIDFIDSMTVDELFGQIADLMRRNVEDDDTRIAVQVPLSTDRFIPFLDDGYKTVHEVDGDFAQAGPRMELETAHGTPGGIDPELRAASGYIIYGPRRRALREQVTDEKARADVYDPDNDPRMMLEEAGKALQYGKVQVILRPEVRERSKFGWGDSFNSFYVAAMMSGASDDQLVKGVVASHGGINNGFGPSGEISSGKRFSAGHLEQLLDVLRIGDETILGSWEAEREDGDQSKSIFDGITEDDLDTIRTARQYYHEALVSGRFDLRDVEEIVFPIESFEPAAGFRTEDYLSGAALKPENLRRGTRDWKVGSDRVYGLDVAEIELSNMVASGKISQEDMDFIINAMQRNREFDISTAQRPIRNLAFEFERVGALQRKHERRMELLEEVMSRNPDVAVRFQNQYGIDWLDPDQHAIALMGDAEIPEFDTIEELYEIRWGQIVESFLSEVRGVYGSDLDAYPKQSIEEIEASMGQFG